MLIALDLKLNFWRESTTYFTLALIDRNGRSTVVVVLIDNQAAFIELTLKTYVKKLELKPTSITTLNLRYD